MPTPMKSAKTMTGRISALAIEATGLAGTIATKTCMIDGASLTLTTASDVIWRPRPGCARPATLKPMTMAIAVVTR